MACRLFGENPLSEPMVFFRQLDPEEHISITFYLKFKSFHANQNAHENIIYKSEGHLISVTMC